MRRLTYPLVQHLLQIYDYLITMVSFYKIRILAFSPALSVQNTLAFHIMIRLKTLPIRCFLVYVYRPFLRDLWVIWSQEVRRLKPTVSMSVVLMGLGAVIQLRQVL